MSLQRMARSPGSRSSRATRTSPTGVGSVGFDYGTSSDIDGSNFEDPKDIADIAAIETDIGGRQPTPPRRPPMGGIDLGKGLDLEKPKPPRSAIGLEIGKSAGGNLGIGVEVPIGLSPFGARGGIAIDPATGQIRGGYGGLGIGKGATAASIDVGADTPIGSEKTGCFKYVTVSLGPFSHTYGKNECEPKEPTTQSNPGSSTDFPLDWEIPRWPVGDPKKHCTYILAVKHRKADLWGNSTFNEYEYEADGSYIPATSSSSESLVVTVNIIKSPYGLPSVNPRSYPNSAGRWGASGSTTGRFNFFNQTTSNAGSTSYCVYGYFGTEAVLNDYLNNPNNNLLGFYYANPTYNQWSTTYKVIYSSCGLPENQLNAGDPLGLPPNLSNSLPNAPPTKKMNDDCCKILIALQLETLRMMGREVSSNQLLPVSNKPGFLGEEIERKETPIDPRNPNKKTKIKISSLYDLINYSLKEQIALDEAIDPRSFKRPTGKIQNPEYSRDVGQSLISNNQPDKDKNRNKRELEINKDVEILSVLQQQEYIFNALRRLEYLFPFGELSDALIKKSLLIPGAEGEIKIHNMIQAYEIQMQYLDAALGNPREIITIKDANPAIEGDQPIEVRSLSISDLLRQNIKFHIDTGGDVDALVNLVLRDFRTNLANRIDMIKSAEMIQALFEDSGMLEEQKYIKIHLEGDPYAGQWVKGKGFEANPDLERKTEEATEKVLRETMKPYDIKIKVSRRHKDEKTDMRDLLRGLADFVQRLLSIPSAGDAAKSIDKLVESAKFKVQTDMALIRQNVTQAAAASRNRTKKRKK